MKFEEVLWKYDRIAIDPCAIPFLLKIIYKPSKGMLEAIADFHFTDARILLDGDRNAFGGRLTDPGFREECLYGVSESEARRFVAEVSERAGECGISFREIPCGEGEGRITAFVALRERHATPEPIADDEPATKPNPIGA